MLENHNCNLKMSTATVKGTSLFTEKCHNTVVCFLLQGFALINEEFIMFYYAFSQAIAKKIIAQFQKPRDQH